MELIVAIALGLAGLALPTAVFLYEHRRSPKSIPNEPVRAGKKTRTVALWTIGRFYQSCRQFDQYCDRLEREEVATENDLLKPSREDLLRFAEAVLLAAAVDILPFSQGKANLFHFVDAPHQQMRHIASQSFIGAFPPSQVLGSASTYRSLEIHRDHNASSVAGECLRIGRSRLEKIKDKGSISGKEIELGTTHILGIPIRFGPEVGADNFCEVLKGKPAAITVDLRVVFMRPFMFLIKCFLKRRSACLCNRLSRYSALQSPVKEAT
jgi:hypothetical protein